MRHNHRIASVVIVAVVAIALLVGAQAFFSLTPTSQYATYNEPPSAVHARLHQTATAGAVSIRLNGVSDARNPVTRDTWTRFNSEKAVYNFSLSPPPGERYVVANVTVTNTQHKAVSFTYTDFLVIGRDNHAYYATYAVCDKDCGASILKNRTLNSGSTDDLYVLFSIPASADVVKLAYVSSSASIVITAA